MTEHDLRDIIRCAESETGLKVRAEHTEDGVILTCEEREEILDCYDNSLPLGWRWV